MVCYCCVKGCSNNSNIKKKDPGSAVSFHAFPSNPEQRSKWLRAIGRPNWNPPSHIRICSTHFSADQISLDGIRTRILEHAYPVQELPPNSNFEASQVEVCRICLSTDIKLYSLLSGLLKTSINFFDTGRNVDGLPQFVCYECAALLIKYYRLFQKSLVAQATLLDVFSRHGQITETLVMKLNRKELNLESSLSNHSLTSKVYEYKYDDVNNSSLFTKKLSSTCENLEIAQQERKNENKLLLEHNLYKTKTEVKMYKEDITYIKHNELEEQVKNDYGNHEESGELLIDIEDITDDYGPNNGDIFVEEHYAVTEESGIDSNKCVQKDNRKSKRNDCYMQEYFTIETLSLEKQIEEWTKLMKRRAKSNYIECGVCSRQFAHQTSYASHMAAHDPSRGASECPVCKRRFKSESLVRSHCNFTHSKKYRCKACPRLYTSVAMAKKHVNCHPGQQSKGGNKVGGACVRNNLSTSNLPESVDKQELNCEQCDLSFTSEAEKRVHVMTSFQHRKKSDPSDPANLSACKTCGEQFSSRREFRKHCQSQHPRKKTSWSLPDDAYPTQCEHCSSPMPSRREHWRHVRLLHPSQRHLYRRLVSALCAACGKGFQNTTKLRLHELRHRSPTIRCDSCPKLFYDKYLLALHLATHSDARPHVCRVCGRAFKLKGNCDRHYRVHTDVASYECHLCSKKFKYSTSLNLHVRSVHYKIPPPLRKKRRNRNAVSQDI